MSNEILLFIIINITTLNDLFINGIINNNNVILLFIL